MQLLAIMRRLLLRLMYTAHCTLFATYCCTHTRVFLCMWVCVCSCDKFVSISINLQFLRLTDAHKKYIRMHTPAHTPAHNHMRACMWHIQKVIARNAVKACRMWQVNCCFCTTQKNYYIELAMKYAIFINFYERGLFSHCCWYLFS